MFELASAFLFLLASLVLVVFVNSEMRDYALQEARDRSRLMLDHNLAIHEYFNDQLKPRLFERLGRSTSPDPTYFDPVWMSSTYAVREINKISSVPAKKNELFYYKEAAVSARSPENEADAYERDFLDALRSDESLNEWSGVREIDGRPYFQTLVRGESMEAPCLRCHGAPDNAPGDLVDQYGPERSFDRFEGQLVSALSVRIPLGAAYDHADAFSRTLYGAIAGVLLMLFLLQWLMTRRLIIHPLNSIRHKVAQIAQDESKLGERIGRFDTREFNEVAAAFNSLSTNLKHVRDTLETRVDQRTDELRRSLEELQGAQDTLVRQEKLASIGTLSAGVAHEILNPLNIIGTIVQMLKMEDELPAEVHEQLDEVVVQIGRATKITSSLRNFSRQDREIEIREVDLHALLDNTLELIQHDLKLDNIEVQKHYGQEVSVIAADPDQLAQVLINLIHNARDAMHDSEVRRLSFTTSRMGEMVGLAVADSGSGISADHLPKLFDPFFTTKEPGSGTGMGLPIVHSIIESMGGFIEVDSTPGRGTEFLILLPRSTTTA